MAEDPNAEKKIAKPMTLARKTTNPYHFRANCPCTLTGFKISKDFLWKTPPIR